MNHAEIEFLRYYIESGPLRNRTAMSYIRPLNQSTPMEMDVGCTQCLELHELCSQLTQEKKCILVSQGFADNKYLQEAPKFKVYITLIQPISTFLMIFLPS